ncbi:MAG: phenylalanine--tRNA ligase subunit beta [Candidatus Omnitrophica bacterium]|nr:phenylalanine--tRNA ligase subunit beta [Candidatus Omnitrophota bacterium]
MKLPYLWLKDYVPLNVSIEKLAHRLTMAGLEVEKIEEVDGEAVLELEITPNRPDCLNMVGLAREVSAIFNKDLKFPKAGLTRWPSQKVDVKVEDPQGCPRYIATLIRNVNIAPAPEPMQRRLQSVGLRPINNLVDITNFCLMEQGQPLHAFDYDKLIGGKIIVRRAHQGEEITTLDGIRRVLDPSILVIADERRAVAVAGIIGGEGTQVTEKTKNILLESAYFDPILIRRAARRLGISTDSSYRFERGVDAEGVERVAIRATVLIKDLAEGKVEARRDVAVGKEKKAKKEISIRNAQVNALLGANVSVSQSRQVLQKLGFRVSTEDKDKLVAEPPSFRGDVRREVDLIEEIARVIGYDALPMDMPLVKGTTTVSSSRFHRRSRIRQALCSQGCYEVVTYALINSSVLEKCGLKGHRFVRVQNPLTQEQEILRPSMLPSLLNVVGLNVRRGEKNLRIFEIGKVYAPLGERETLGMIFSGQQKEDWRNPTRIDVDFYDLKGSVEAVLSMLGSDGLTWVSTDLPFFVVGQGAQIYRKDRPVGILGRISPDILKAWDIKQDKVIFAQVDLEDLLGEERHREYHPIPAYPSVVRDVSLAIKKDIPFQRLKDLAFQEGSHLLTEIRFLEQYEGEKISSDERGLVFSLVYQSSQRTLTDEEVNQVHEKICQSLVTRFGARIR